MNRRDLILGAFGGAAALSACGSAAQAPPRFPMRRGVNLGNALEAPREGEWGFRIEPGHLDAIAGAGFDGVRLPVRWDAHAGAHAPYTIDPDFLARVDEVLSLALGRGLKVQLDCHHEERLIAAPHAERARFLELWRQIARHCRAMPDALLFEPFNEPSGDYWRREHLSDLQRDVLDIVRAEHPTRLVVLGGGNWNSIDGLAEWRPPQDPHIAISVHYYEPHDFTHQNAEWLGREAPHFDRAWGTAADRRAIAEHAGQAARWAAAHGLALQLGEFGVNRAAPMAQRALWTRSVREVFEAQGAGWCAWDFAGAFPIWDREMRRFIPEMREALLG